MMPPAHPTILVVEDETDLRDGIRDALELNGYSVLAARDGVEALELLNDFVPCMVLLDLVMPRMDGWDLCETLRGRPTFEQVPIIVHSSSTRTAPSGATRVIAKPLSYEGLLELVATHCSRARPA